LPKNNEKKRKKREAKLRVKKFEFLILSRSFASRFRPRSKIFKQFLKFLKSWKIFLPNRGATQNVTFARIGASFNQYFSNLRQIRAGSNMKRSKSVFRPMKIHIDSKFNQRRKKLGVIGFNGGEQCLSLRFFAHFFAAFDCFFQLDYVDG
jgi:hypothetical protein